MKERFSSAKSQLAKLIDGSSAETQYKQGSIPSDPSVWINHSMGSAFQPTPHSPGTDKSLPETSSCTKLDCSEASSFDSGIQSKIEKMMARTKNIEQKLVTQLQTSPKNKVLGSNGKLKTEKALKCFQRVDKFKQQLQNQPSVRELVDDRKLYEVLDVLWREFLAKPFDLKGADEGLVELRRYVSEWKQNSKNYLILSEQVLSSLEGKEIADVDIPKLLESCLQEKSIMHGQLNIVNQQIHRLTSTISKLQEDRVFYLAQINERDMKINFLDSEVERLKLNNNCLTEIIYKLQQKKAENQSRVGKGVYDHLQEENQKLKQTLAQIVDENKHLTIALTEEISFVREAIFDEIKKKMLLHADLLKAESTIEELRNVSVMDVSRLKSTISKQLQLKHNEVCERYIPDNYEHSSTQPSQEAESDLLHSRLTESNDHILHLQGLLDESRRITGDMETERTRWETANRKEEYQRQKIKKQVHQIKKVLSEEPVREAEDIDAELISVHQKALEAVFKLKNAKERASVLEIEYSKRGDEVTKLVGEYDMLSKRYMSMRLAKNPSGNEEKLIELQNINTQLQKDIESIASSLKSKEEVIDSRNKQILLKDQELLGKDEEIKGLLQSIERLMTDNRKLLERENTPEVNPERAQTNSCQQQELNDLRLQLQAGMSDSNFNAGGLKSGSKHSDKIRRMKSLSICSNQDLIMEDLQSNIHSNIARSIGQKSEISDCWNNTSGIHELAQRIDSLGVLGFKIDQLFDKYNVRGEIAQILSPFLKKLDKMQNLEELLLNVEEMLERVKGITQIHNEEDNAFLKFNLARMGELFAQTRMYLQAGKGSQEKDRQLDSEEEGMLDQLTIQSVLQI